MKRLILILLLSYSFCNIPHIYYLEKYGEVKSTSRRGIVYLNIEDFQLKDTIYILFNVVNGAMATRIEYGYDDLAPEDLNIYLEHTMVPTMNAESQTDTFTEHTYTLKYYYDIEKEENKKFLIIRYCDFDGEYLEIENTKVNWARTVLIIVFGSIGIIILIIVIICYIIRCKRRWN